MICGVTMMLMPMMPFLKQIMKQQMIKRTTDHHRRLVVHHPVPVAVDHDRNHFHALVQSRQNHNINPVRLIGTMRTVNRNQLVHQVAMVKELDEDPVRGRETADQIVRH